ncbi:hypothetical protein G9A89_018637 [Geosiphon pyriformis]|nr:hypothetical protein G9A89_018637 [Geosiphon pyriformis]
MPPKRKTTHSVTTRNSKKQPQNNTDQEVTSTDINQAQLSISQQPEVADVDSSKASTVVTTRRGRPPKAKTATTTKDVTMNEEQNPPTSQVDNTSKGEDEEQPKKVVRRGRPTKAQKAEEISKAAVQPEPSPDEKIEEDTGKTQGKRESNSNEKTNVDVPKPKNGQQKEEAEDVKTKISNEINDNVLLQQEEPESKKVQVKPIRRVRQSNKASAEESPAEELQDNKAKSPVKRGRKPKKTSTEEHATTHSPIEDRTDTKPPAKRGRSSKPKPEETLHETGTSQSAPDKNHPSESDQPQETPLKTTVKRGRPKKPKIDTVQTSADNAQEKPSESTETKQLPIKNNEEAASQDLKTVANPSTKGKKKKEQLSSQVDEISPKPQDQTSEDLSLSAPLPSGKKGQKQDDVIPASTSDPQNNDHLKEKPKGTPKGRAKRQKQEGIPTGNETSISTQKSSTDNGSTTNHSATGSSQSTTQRGRKRKQKQEETNSQNTTDKAEDIEAANGKQEDEATKSETTGSNKKLKSDAIEIPVELNQNATTARKSRRIQLQKQNVAPKLGSRDLRSAERQKAIAQNSAKEETVSANPQDVDQNPEKPQTTEIEVCEGSKNKTNDVLSPIPVKSEKPPQQPVESLTIDQTPPIIDIDPKLDIRMAKFLELRKRKDDSAQANRKELYAEHQRSKINPKEDIRRERKREEAEKLMTQKEAEKNGEDWERKNFWKYSAESVEKWEEKQEKKAKRAEIGFTDYNQVAEKKYNRLINEFKPNLAAYNEQKAAALASASLVTTEDGELVRIDAESSFYRDANSLSYATVDRTLSREAIDRVVIDVNKQIAKRAQYSRERPINEDDDITYINERNRRFNFKIARHYDPYTKEIKENFERGTAL